MGRFGNEGAGAASATTSQCFRPGHYLDSSDRRARCATGRARGATTTPPRGVKVAAGSSCAQASKHAVHRQLMTDVPYGVLLSGGLDSSLVAACAARFARQRVEDDDREEAWWPRLHSLRHRPGRIARPGGRARSPPRRSAPCTTVQLHRSGRPRRACRRDPPHRNLRRHHHPRLHADVPDGAPHQGDGREDGAVRRRRGRDLRRLPVFPQGADRRAAFHEETVRKLDALAPVRLPRANKAMAAWGVEARVPFLDLDSWMSRWRMDARAQDGTRPGQIEKAVLREAFVGALPDRSCGGRRSSSATASATAGSTR